MLRARGNYFARGKTIIAQQTFTKGAMKVEWSGRLGSPRVDGGGRGIPLSKFPSGTIPPAVCRKRVQIFETVFGLRHLGGPVKRHKYSNSGYNCHRISYFLQITIVITDLS